MLSTNNVRDNFCHAREKNRICLPEKKITVIKITNFARGKTQSHGSTGRKFLSCALGAAVCFIEILAE